jgi:hypothetical protein
MNLLPFLGSRIFVQPRFLPFLICPIFGSENTWLFDGAISEKMVDAIKETQHAGSGVH